MSDEFDDLVDTATLALSAAAQGPQRRPARALVPRLVSRLYAGADRGLRQRLLARLLAPLGPLGLAGIAAGAFAVLLQPGRPAAAQIAAEDVTRFSNQQILELARFVEQVSPQALQQVANLVAANPVGPAAFSASVALLLMRALRRRASETSP